MNLSASSPVRYPGGKFRARKLLFEKLPASIHHYATLAQSVEQQPLVVSPFFGGGSFELFLTERKFRVAGFDGFDLLANFWNVLLARPDALADALQAFHGTVDSPVFKNLQKSLRECSERRELFGEDSTNVEGTPGAVSDERVRRAAEFLVVNRCSFSGATLSGGFSKASASDRFTQSVIDKVRAFHNPALTVEYGLFEQTFKNLPEGTDFLFLDPPYLLEQSKNKLYGIGGSLHQSFDHEGLRDVVLGSNLPFMLTYNDSPVVRDLWRGYGIEEAAWSYGMNKSKKSSEIIIRNYD